MKPFRKQPYWDQCGWPSKRDPARPCNQPTVDGVACAKHSQTAATRAPALPLAEMEGR
jgi:hypothetical protein